MQLKHWMAGVIVASSFLAGTSSYAVADGGVDVSDKGNGTWVGKGTAVGQLRDKKVTKPSSKKSTSTKKSKATSTKAAEPVEPMDAIAEYEWMYEHNCWAMSRGCFIKTKKTGEAAEVTQVDPEDVARELVVQLQLPDPTPRFGPDPSANEWKMAAVGYPLWLWTDGPRQVSTTASRYGISFTLTANWRSTTFNMGDGNRVTCTDTKKYTTSVKAGAKSPKCGYTYAKSSLPKGKYRVTATTNWRITWSALGQSGTLPGTHSASRDLPVGELNALVVG